MPRGLGGPIGRAPNDAYSNRDSARTHRLVKSFGAMLLGCTALLPLAGAAHAADWDGSSSTDWFNGANWTPAAVPGAADSVNIDTTAPNEAVINGGVANAALTRVGRFATGALTIENAGKLNSTSGVLGFQNGSNGTVTVRDADSAWTLAGSLSVGEAGSGILKIENGGKVTNAGTGYVGATPSGVGFVTVTGQDSLWQIGGNLRLGQTGDGTLRILDQASVSVDQSVLFGANSGELEIASTGDMSVSGSFIQGANGTYVVGLNPADADSGHIQVTGTANIDTASTLEAVNEGPGGTYTVGTRYTVLTADGGVTGEYGSLTGDVVVSPFIGLALAYDANNVYIDVALLQSFANAGLTPNQRATGAGIESLGGGNPIFDIIANLPSEEAARAAFDLLSGEIHASAKGVLMDESRFLRDAVNTRLRQAFGSEDDPQMAMRFGMIEAAADVAPASRRLAAFWSYGFGSWGQTDSDDNAAALDRSTGGFFLGVDTVAGDDWRIGLIGGYSHTSFDVDGRDSSGSSDNIHAGLYGGHQWDNLGLRLGAAYTWHDIETSRTVPIPAPAELTADYNAGTAQLFGEVGYRLAMDRVSFEPFAALAYVNLHTDAYSEEGGPAALSTDSETSDTIFTTLGTHWAASLLMGKETNLAFQGTVGWRHAFDDVTPESTFAFAGGDDFQIAGVPIAEDAFVVNAGIGIAIAENATLGVSYSGQIGADAEDHGITGNLSVTF